MNDSTDSELLRDYEEKRSEAAFAELVRRHVDFVYSAALRMVRNDSHLAQDVTQGVFVALAKNASQLIDHKVLSGWLHRTAHNIAAQNIRTEVRRRAREQEAVAMNELLSAEPDAAWENIAPYLDTALGELSEPDRDALLLRYFERKSAREMAQTLNVSEEAAQKRVNRAVERLREFFSKRNVTIGASGLAVLISTNAVQAAPIGLITLISTAAGLVGTTIAATTIATHTTMNWINIKTISTVIAASLVSGTGTYLIQKADMNRMGEENKKLIATNSVLIGERDSALSLSTANIAELEHLRKGTTELLRLRGEVGVLRKQVSEQVSLKQENFRLRTADSIAQKNQLPQAPVGGQTNFSKESWAFAGYATPEAALQTWTWAMSKGDKQTMLASLVPDERIKWEKDLAHEDIAGEGAKILGYQVVNQEIRSDSEVDLTISWRVRNGRTNKMKWTIQKLEGDWKIVGPAKNQ